MQKKNCKGEEYNKLPRNPLGGYFSLSSPHQSSPMQLQCVKTTPATTGTADRSEKHAAPHACAEASVTTGNSENRSVSTGSQFN
jgi:hypothetical protein